MNLKSVEKKEKSTATLTVEISAEEFDAAVEKVYRKNKNMISLPGFRKGKAPRKLVEQMYGEDIFYEDAVDDLCPVALTDAVKESGLDMVGYPSVEMQELGKEGVTFTATIGVRPVPVLGQYKGIEAPKTEVVVTPEDVDEEMQPYVSRASRQVTVERPAADGDTVMIDFEGTRDGVPFEGGSAENYELELGSGSFIPGFEEQLVGMSAGEEKDVTATFPDEYMEPDLAGAEAQFHVLIHEVRTTEPPELDDEFAKDVSEFDTLEEFRADLEKRLRERWEETAQKDFENAVLDRLIETTEMEIPDTMVEYEADRIVEDYENRMQGYGFTFDQYLQMMGSSRAAFREEAKVAALRQIQGNLIFEAIADAEEIVPTEEEMDAEYQKVADEYDMELDDVKEMVPEEEIRRQLKGTMASRFVYDAAVAVALAAPEETEDGESAAEDEPSAEEVTAEEPAQSAPTEETEPAEEKSEPEEGTAAQADDE